MNLTRRSVLGSGGLTMAAALNTCSSNTGLGGKEPSGGGPALTQWYHQHGGEGVKEAVERYTAEYTAMKVDAKWNPDDYGSIPAAQLLTNDVPDVFEVEQGGSLDMIRSGQLEDLTETIVPVRDDFSEAVTKRLTFDGKIHDIPQTIDIQLPYYRPSLLQAVGAAAPATFDDLVRAANIVAISDMGGFFAGNKGRVGVLGSLLIWASGHDQLDADRTAAAFPTDDFYAVLFAYRDFYQSNGLLKVASVDWFSDAAFVNDETAMQWGGLWSSPEIIAAHGDDVGALPFPAIGAKGWVAVLFGAFGSCVAARGKNVAAAKEFVKWLWIDQTDKQMDFSDSYGTHTPTRKSLVATARKLQSGPGAGTAESVGGHGFASDITQSGSLGDTYSVTISNVVVQGQGPVQAFAGFADLAATESAKLKG